MNMDVWSIGLDQGVRRHARRERIRHVCLVDPSEQRVIEIDLDRRQLGKTKACRAGLAEVGPEIAARGQKAVTRLTFAAGAGLELARLFEWVDPHLRVRPD